jgi:hypothetical protein
MKQTKLTLSFSILQKVFLVHKNNSIKCFTDPLGDDDQVEEEEIDDDAPWDEEKITGVDTRVHSRSQLAVSYDKNTVFVFYQKPNGTLGCINEYSNQWRNIALPDVAALDGTPLATCNTNYAVFLFYISIDGTVRYLENREGKWNGVYNISFRPRLECALTIIRCILLSRQDGRPQSKFLRFSHQIDYCRRQATI